MLTIIWVFQNMLLFYIILIKDEYGVNLIHDRTTWTCIYIYNIYNILYNYIYTYILGLGYEMIYPASSSWIHFKASSRIASCWCCWRWLVRSIWESPGRCKECHLAPCGLNWYVMGCCVKMFKPWKMMQFQIATRDSNSTDGFLLFLAT